MYGAAARGKFAVTNAYDKQAGIVKMNAKTVANIGSPPGIPTQTNQGVRATDISGSAFAFNAKCSINPISLTSPVASLKKTVLLLMFRQNRILRIFDFPSRLLLFESYDTSPVSYETFQ
jgi:hypothetical protein